MSTLANYTEVTLHSGTVTATANGAELPVDFSNAQTAKLHIILSNVTGTSPTLTVGFQDTLNGTDFGSVASTSSLTTSGVTVLTLTTTNGLARRGRLFFTVGGTTPSFDVTVIALLKS